MMIQDEQKIFEDASLKLGEALNNEWNKFWKDALKVANGESQELTLSSGKVLTTNESQVYFKHFGGSQVTVDFMCLSDKGSKVKTFAEDYKLSNINLAANVDISIGVNIRC